MLAEASTRRVWFAPAAIGAQRFDWGAGSLDPVVPVNNFGAQWTEVSTFDGGAYRFSATGDDGIRVLLDGVVVLDGWSDHPPTSYTVDIPITAGQHAVVVEYYERTGGAVATFSLTLLCASCCGAGC